MTEDGKKLLIVIAKKQGEYMPNAYHHLNKEKRFQLYILMKQGLSISLIANELEVNRSTIYREIKRNQGKRGYRYTQAQEMAIKRQRSKAKKIKMNIGTIAIIKKKLNLQWSPEQISGWMKKQAYQYSVSHETIYRYIWEDKKKGGILYKHLRHSGKKYNKRGSNRAGRGYIPGRIEISKRPKIVEKKERLGDWELDTIIGRDSSGVIVSMVERRSKLTKLEKISRKTADQVKSALIKRLAPIQEFVITLTSDNGKEFAFHQQVSQSLKTDFYFATPYHSWERGLNEHTNGLVRQYFPKSKRFDEISIDNLKEIEELLNNRPRKVLNFWTPKEIFNHLTKETSNVAFCG